MESSRYRPELDGLRAIAVLAVVAFHFGLPVPAGFVGVDVFFVISGYLITGILRSELPRIDFLGFYARRARRILPAMTVVILTTLAASMTLLPDSHDAVASAAAAAAFVANVFFQAKTGSYWSASSATMPLLHLWSLSVEEQFYLVWPVVMLLARKKPAAALWTIAIVSFIAAEWLVLDDPNAAFYQMPARAWELSAGGLVALGAIRARGSMLPSLLLIVGSCFVPMPQFPALGALSAVAGATWLIAILHGGGTVGVLRAKPLVGIGLISYSLYLWHWPLLALDRAMRVGDAPMLVRLELGALAFLLAILTYRWIETPFRRSRANKRRAVALGVACAATLSASALAIAPPAVSPAHELQQFAICDGSHKFAAPVCVQHQRKVILWGDSFTWPWQPLALALAKEQSLAPTFFVETGCPVTAGETIEYGTPKKIRECRAHNDKVLEYISANGADAVVIATDLADFFRSHPEQASRGWHRLIDELQPHVGRIVIVAPTPSLKDDVDNCIAANDPCMATRAEFEAQAGAAKAALSELGSLAKVEIVDAGEWFLARDRNVYDDRSHVAQAAVEQFLAGRSGRGVAARSRTN